MLLVKSTDGGATFGAPVKVADYYDLPDCATYQAGQDAGRACVPEKPPRRNSISARPTTHQAPSTRPIRIESWSRSVLHRPALQRNEIKTLHPAGFVASGNNVFTGVRLPARARNDILVSVSTKKRGCLVHWHDNRPPNSDQRRPRSAQATADQWWQWSPSPGAAKAGHFLLRPPVRNAGGAIATVRSRSGQASESAIGCSARRHAPGGARIAVSKKRPPTWAVSDSTRHCRRGERYSEGEGTRRSV